MKVAVAVEVVVVAVAVVVAAVVVVVVVAVVVAVVRLDTQNHKHLVCSGGQSTIDHLLGSHRPVHHMVAPFCLHLIMAVQVYQFHMRLATMVAQADNQRILMVLTINQANQAEHEHQYLVLLHAMLHR